MELTSRKLTANYLLVSSAVVVAVCVTMFSGWEMGGETWGYWYFARVFAETGNFVVLDRSPLYVLYLNLFSWMPYPASVTAEYLVTTSITVIALVAFSRPYLGILLALLAACIWIPYLQSAEPPVQKLALACSLVAVLLRGGKADRFRLAASYAFLGLAYLFRPTYILLVILFVASDMLWSTQGNRTKTWLSWRPKFTNDWPIILIIGLLLWFLFSQSSSPWNNVGFTATEWFPNDGKSMVNGAGAQNFNWKYIELKYGTFEGHDFYFTNQEAFSGAKSLFGMLVANPQLFFEIVILNLKDLVPNIMGFVWLPRTGVTLIDYSFMLAIFVGAIYGAFRAARNFPTKILIAGSLALVGVTVISIPKVRYMFPVIPIFIMASSWYGTNLATLLKKICPDEEKLHQKITIIFLVLGILSLLLYSITDYSVKPLRATVLLVGTIFAFVCAVMMFAVARFAKTHLRTEMSRFALALPAMFFLIWFSSSNLQSWSKIPREVVKGFGGGHVRLLENIGGVSVRAAYPELAGITQTCKGIMSLEYNFLGAFLDIPQSKVYTPWEIPPFGRLNNSSYKGLNPDRIDCVLVSSSLETDVGFATNIQIRYQNYVKPYVSQLQSLGAVTYEIPHFGQAVILQR